MYKKTFILVEIFNDYKMDKKEQVLKAFKDAGKALKQAEVADQTGIDKKEVAKLVKQLVTDGKVYSPKACFYQAK